MQDFIQWFGEQTETVKLAIIGVVSVIVTGFWAAVNQLVKPVLRDAPAGPTTSPGAPKAADDPVVLLAAAIEGIGFQLTEMKMAMERNHAGDIELRKAIEDMTEKLEAVTRELYAFNVNSSRNSMGM